jgi:hypothetical protein
MWAWLTLSDKTQGKWDEQSFYEEKTSSSPIRSSLPQSSQDSGRKKVIIHIITTHTDRSPAFDGLCDSYIQYLPPTNESVSEQNYISQFLDAPGNLVNYPEGSDKPNKPSTAATYDKLCNRIKQDGIEAYIINFSDGGFYYNQENFYKKCVGDDHYINMTEKGYGNYGIAMDSILSGLTGDSIIRIIK